MKMITVQKIWENGDFVGTCLTPFVINCDRISGSTPREAWLIPTGGGCCGIGSGWKLSFENPNPSDEPANTLAGVLHGIWIEGDGGGALYDAEEVADITDACNACCDDPTPVVPVYDGVYPSPASITETTFTITRADDGNTLAYQRAQLDYLGQYQEGTFMKTAYDGTNSTYTFKAKGDPHKIGSDTIVETARTFDSNAPGAIVVGNHYIANGTVNGVTLPTLEDDAYNVLSDVATAAAGNATWAAAGTWSVVSSKLRLTSSTVVSASLVITSAAD